MFSVFNSVDFGKRNSDFIQTVYLLTLSESVTEAFQGCIHFLTYCLLRQHFKKHQINPLIMINHWGQKSCNILHYNNLNTTTKQTDERV